MSTYSVNHVCHICNQTFTTQRESALYCSKACQRKAAAEATKINLLNKALDPFGLSIRIMNYGALNISFSGTNETPLRYLSLSTRYAPLATESPKAITEYDAAVSALTNLIAVPAALSYIEIDGWGQVPVGTKSFHDVSPSLSPREIIGAIANRVRHTYVELVLHVIERQSNLRNFDIEEAQDNVLDLLAARVCATYFAFGKKHLSPLSLGTSFLGGTSKREFVLDNLDMVREIMHRLSAVVVDCPDCASPTINTLFRNQLLPLDSDDIGLVFEYLEYQGGYLPEREYYTLAELRIIARIAEARNETLSALLDTRIVPDTALKLLETSSEHFSSPNRDFYGDSETVIDYLNFIADMECDPTYTGITSNDFVAPDEDPNVLPF